MSGTSTTWKSPFPTFTVTCSKWRSWLRYCGTTPKVSGSIPDGVINTIFPSALFPWSRLSLWRQRVPRIFLGGKGGRCVGLTNLPPLYTVCLQILEPHPPEILRACPGLCRDLLYRVSELEVYKYRYHWSSWAYNTSHADNSWKELEYRLDICLATTGAHIEVYECA
jgi:hypothetical protein